MNIIDRASSLRCVGAAAALLVLVAVPAQGQCPDGSPPPCGGSAPSSRPALDTDVVAIAPFDVLVPGLELWREGMVDVLSRRLDGAGPLRTVSASAVINGWSGRADPASARRLGRRTRAQYAVFGELVGAGADSVRISVSVLDVAAGRVTGTSEARNATARMDLLADTLTLRLLAVLGRARGGGVLSVADFDTRSLPALKAYLEGEQLFRQARHDSAAVHFRHAISLDSGFTQAHRRLAWTEQWQCTGEAPDFSLLDGVLLRYAKIRGLSPRDSMAIQLDSMFAALTRGGSWVDIYADLVGEMIGATERAVRAYPRDAEFWHLRGEAVLARAGQNLTALDAFERAIAADPGLAPPYLDAAEMAARIGEYARAKKFLQGYLRLSSEGDCAIAARLFDDLLPGGLSGASRARRIATIPSGQLWKVEGYFNPILDAAETSPALQRVALSRRLPRGATRDTLAAIRFSLSLALRLRGHLNGSDSIAPVDVWGHLNRLFIGAATPSVLPAKLLWDAETAPLGATHPYGLWLIELMARDRNIAFFDRFISRADSLRELSSIAPSAESARDSGARVFKRDTYGYAVALSHAGRTLAMGDTTAAIHALEALSDSVCYGCFQHVVMLARLHASRGHHEAAARYYRREHKYLRDARHVLWAFERAQVLERIGDRVAAKSNYQFVVDAWLAPDAPLVTYVEQSRQALRRLR